MMAFADKDFYVDEYLRGRQAVIPLDKFEFYAMQASVRINWRNAELSAEQVIEPLKMAVCQAAEILFRAEAAMGAPDAPAKRSESVGGYSVSYADTGRTAREINDDIRGVVRMWLSGTVVHDIFVYSGVL